MQNSDSHRSCFGPVTGIKGRLATAAQFLRTIYRMPQALEDTDHADAHLRKKEIHETGNKQGYGHLAWSEASRVKTFEGQPNLSAQFSSNCNWFCGSSCLIVRSEPLSYRSQPRRYSRCSSLSACPEFRIRPRRVSYSRGPSIRVATLMSCMSSVKGPPISKPEKVCPLPLHASTHSR